MEDFIKKIDQAIVLAELVVEELKEYKANHYLTILYNEFCERKRKDPDSEEEWEGEYPCSSYHNPIRACLGRLTLELYKRTTWTR